ncbi:MAG: hypothetical protein K8U57_34345 [Planctomycetes bacterium]|nr:hypothetical protein [Planctomycetota bacterium]
MKIAEALLDKIDGILDCPLDSRVYSIWERAPPRTSFLGGLTEEYCLKLVAKCLFSVFDAEGDLLDGDEEESATVIDSQRLARVKEKFAKLASRKSGACFVVCYELGGNDGRGMAWSDSIPPGKAFAEMITAIRENL